MKNKKGTTLIEVLLYTIIAGFFVSTISIFAWNALSAKNKNDSLVNVDDSMQIIIEEISKSIRNADSIIVPANKGDISDILVLNYSDGNSKTFIFDNQEVTMQYLGNSYTISSKKTTVDNLTFTNLSKASTPGLIQVNIKMSRKNPNNLNELEAENEIIISESLRK